MTDISGIVAEVDGVCGSRATVIGRRIEVRHVLGWMALGMTAEDVAREYDLTREQVNACLTWAEQLVERHYGLDREEPVGRLVSSGRVARAAPR